MQAILLNGTSSAGKTSLARALQCLLQPDHLYAGVDAFLLSLPPPRHNTEDGGRYAPVRLPDGRDATTIEVGPVGLELLRAWHRAMASIVRGGVPVILDEVLLSSAIRQSYAEAFRDLPLMMVKVHCDPAVAEERERSRGDRVLGLATGLGSVVHDGVAYDAEIDTSTDGAEACAASLADRVEAWRRR